MKIALIVATDLNGLIGRGNDLPWHLPEDLKNFKAITMGHPILMGRNTFESIGKPLPGRTNIVITRNADFKAEGVTVVHSLEEALGAANAETIFVIGGSSIYAEALPRAAVIYQTLVDDEFEGDVYFPEKNLEKAFVKSSDSGALTSEKTGIGYRFLVWNRKTA